MDYATAISKPSPNYGFPNTGDHGREGHTITGLVIHRTAGYLPGCLDWLRNPVSQVSAHYLIALSGTVYQLVAEADAAYHNGAVSNGSVFQGMPNPNLWTIGIEHEADVNNSITAPTAQVAASAALVADILKRHGPLAIYQHHQFNFDHNCPNSPELMAAATAASSPAWVSFTATPLKAHLPLSFYADASFTHNLYTSAATPQTVISLDGWRYGVPVWSNAANAWDARWYHRHNPVGNEGWVPAAFMNGNAPGSTI